jgi:hypothetical protein
LIRLTACWLPYGLIDPFDQGQNMRAKKPDTVLPRVIRRTPVTDPQPPQVLTIPHDKKESHNG